MAFFGKGKDVRSASNAQEIKEQAMEQAIKSAEEEDPLVRAKLGALSVKNALYEVLQKRDPRGVHVDTVLGILGSMSGFSCLLHAYVAQQAGHGANDPQAIAVGTGADGQTYYSGNLINAPLLENQHSVWGLVGGMAQHLGSSQLPDIHDIAKHVAATVGTDEFGVPRMPEGHNLSDMPRNYIRELYPILIKDAKQFTTNAQDFPILFALAIQQVMEDARDVIDPGLAAKIAMECAVPMSKIDPNTAV